MMYNFHINSPSRGDVSVIMSPLYFPLEVCAIISFPTHAHTIARANIKVTLVNELIISLINMQNSDDITINISECNNRKF